MWFTLVQNYNYNLPTLIKYRRRISLVKFSQVFFYSLWLTNSMWGDNFSMFWVRRIHKIFVLNFLTKSLWNVFNNFIFPNQGVYTNNLTHSYVYLSLYNLNHYFKFNKFVYLSRSHIKLRYLANIRLFHLSLYKSLFRKQIFMYMNVFITFTWSYCNIFKIYTNFMLLPTQFFIFYFFNIFFF